MELKTVKDLLDNTIKGKKVLLAAINESMNDPTMNTAATIVAKVTAQFLEINLTELENIKAHLNEVTSI